MKHKFVQYRHELFPENEILLRSRDFFSFMNRRRSVRDFSDKLLPREIIENVIKTASSAPSGAHKQPWTFCAVADTEIKKQIRTAAEKEEWENYHGRMDKEWLEDLACLGTDWQKSYLESAPYLIIVFKKVYDIMPDGSHRQNYYVSESVGIACGFLLAAIHNAGLCALTHTPSPMGFLSQILNRPENERPFLLIPVGYPAEDAKVPDLKRKELNEVSTWY